MTNFEFTGATYGAFKGAAFVGIIATRNNGEHITLFFVAGKCHKLGIGRKLFDTLLIFER